MDELSTVVDQVEDLIKVAVQPCASVEVSTSTSHAIIHVLGVLFESITANQKSPG